MAEPKIFITPMGGHGTTYLTKRAKFAVRPDVIWGDSLNLEDYPCEKRKNIWAKRTAGHELDPTKTIEENLVDAIKRVNRKRKYKLLLSGWCSLKKTFLTDNDIKPIKIVRHPLHAYVSYFGLQHPNHCRALGGFNTPKSVRKWTKQWNAIIEDFLSSSGTIVRYEYFQHDMPASDFKNKLSGFKGTMRDHPKLDSEIEDFLFKLVKKNFFELYADWHICES